jgi:hypothetical protein
MGMLRSFLKKKLSDNQLANIFVNGLLEVIDNGFEEVASLINEDPAFDYSPDIAPSESDEFTMIIIVGNIVQLESHFDYQQALSVEGLIIQKLAPIFGLTESNLTSLISEYKSFISKVNYPSKNVLYGMSKAIFHKYALNDFQEEYFRNMQAPNPLFLKRMDEVVTHFIWNWEAVEKKYKF